MTKTLAIISTLLITVAIMTGCGDTSSLTDNPESSQSSILSNESTIPDTVSGKVSSSDRASSVSIEDLWDDVSSSDESSSDVVANSSDVSSKKETPSSNTPSSQAPSSQISSSKPASAPSQKENPSSKAVESNESHVSSEVAEVEPAQSATSEKPPLENLEEKPDTDEVTDGLSRTAYWTKGGKSYHFSKDCTTLKRSKNILEGTLQDALNAGKKDPCNVCAGGH